MVMLRLTFHARLPLGLKGRPLCKAMSLLLASPRYFSKTDIYNYIILPQLNASILGDIKTDHTRLFLHPRSKQYSG